MTLYLHKISRQAPKNLNEEYVYQIFLNLTNIFILVKQPKVGASNFDSVLNRYAMNDPFSSFAIMYVMRNIFYYSHTAKLHISFANVGITCSCV